MKQIICVLLVGMLSCSIARADTLRCGDRLVSTGATIAEVSLACGEPFWKGNREELLVENLPAGKKFIRRYIEDWTYNFGANSFVYFLRFEGGRLTTISSGGYGFSTAGNSSRCGDGLFISLGDQAGEVALKCGAPIARERSEEEMTGETGKGRARETWTYSFPSGKVVVVTMEDGKVSAVETR